MQKSREVGVRLIRTSVPTKLFIVTAIVAAVLVAVNIIALPNTFAKSDSSNGVANSGNCNNQTTV
jgi:hypothetical protein